MRTTRRLWQILCTWRPNDGAGAHIVCCTPHLMILFSFCTLFIALSLARPLCSSAAPPNQTITPFQAAGKIGQLATVCGKTANTYYSRFVSQKPTFINFGKPYPDQVFSVAVMGNDRINFGDNPEKLFADRNVCVTGLIESYDGKPLMQVKDPSQVHWNE